MITAKNYAAQALRYVEDSAIPALNNKGFSRDANNANIMATLIKGATHFVIPDYGTLLKSKDFKTLSGVPFRMPYPTVTIEFAAPGHGFSKHLIMAAETSIDNPFVQKVLREADAETDCKIAIMIMSMVFSRSWNIVPAGIIMLDTPEIHVDGESIQIFPYLTLPEVLEHHPETTKYDGLTVSKSHVTPLCEFIAALSCTNVGTETHQEAYRDNAKRIAKGKLPIYETKTLTLNVTSEKKGGKGGGGSSTPKRQHFRRGHIRHLQSGNYWVNACIVGKDGFIDKDYRLT